MSRNEFITEMGRVRSEVFPDRSGWRFICHCLRRGMEKQFNDIFSKCLGERYALGPASYGDSKEHITSRVFALQVFEQICLEEKLYEAF